MAPWHADRFVIAGARAPACLVDGLAGQARPDHDGVIAIDLLIDAGRIAALAPAGQIEAAAPRLDAKGRLAWPGPVDLHTHLDKGHIWPRARNLDGSFPTALETVRQDREANWSAADVEARMTFSLRCALAHGTVALRTHLDSQGKQAAISWPVFAALRARFADRLTLQAVALAMPEDYRGEAGVALADLAASHGGILGLVPLPDPALGADLEHFFRLAMDRGLDIDMHVDETEDPAVNTLYDVARTAARMGFAGRLVCGHCCSLAMQDEAVVDRTLDAVAAAGIAIVSLPMCNLYLQDRHAGRTPRWRGVTLLHEMRARGIQVAVASDNTRDPFYAYGDLDLHEVFREAVRIGHFDHPFGDWPSTVTSRPAAIMGLAERGLLRLGAPADLILFEGRGFSEILARPESRRLVLRQGRPIDTALPAYDELDHLFAAAGHSRSEVA
jgi:cytosine deaminase